MSVTISAEQRRNCASNQRGDTSGTKSPGETNILDHGLSAPRESHTANPRSSGTEPVCDASFFGEPLRENRYTRDDDKPDSRANKNTLGEIQLPCFAGK